MVSPGRSVSLTLSRYLARRFFAIFVPVMLCFVLLYVIVDLFERLDILMRNHASVSASFRYFLYKIPLMVTQITPPAVITSLLVSLALLSRHNEIVALRASGVGLYEMALPLLGVALGISAGTLVWNETVVPYCSRQFQHVNNVEIRKRELRGILSDRKIWYHARQGFYHIDHVDRQTQTIHGMAIFRLDDAFHLDRVIEIPRAEWRNGRWEITGAVVRDVGAGAISATPLPPEAVEIPETINEFLEVQREPEELSFLQLRAWVLDLSRKGIDVSRYLVDLHAKLALPFASAVLTMIAIPIAGGVRRHASVAAIMGLGLAVGFGYWVVLALSNSLGQSGTLPAVVAAWAPNVTFVLLGFALFLSSE